MKKFLVSVFILFIFSVSYAVAAPTVYYDVSFDSPLHTVGDIPVTGMGIYTPSEVYFGSPMVENSLGALNSQPLVFNIEGNTTWVMYDQIKFDLGYGADSYSIEFDLLADQYVNTGSTNLFKVIFDTPQVRNIQFRSDGSIRWWSPSYVPGCGYSKKIGSFENSQLLHMLIDINLSENSWSISMNGSLLYSCGFYASDGDIFNIRFSFGKYNSASPTYFDSIGLDNILITSDSTVSVPAIVADNPAAEIFIEDEQINYDADMSNWVFKAHEHWEARQGDSWENYVEQITLPAPPASLPAFPQSVQQNNPVCEAADGGSCFYIDSGNGNDTNPGTFENPWKTYLNIVRYGKETDKPANWKELGPGDVVYFMSGEYSDTYFYYVGDGNYTAKGLFVSASGTDENPITLKAYPGNLPFISAINPDASKTMTAIELDGNNIVFDGFEIRDTKGDGLTISGKKNIEVKNCWIHDIDGKQINNISGIKIDHGSENISVHHNILHDNFDSFDFGINNGNIVIFGGGNIHIHHNIIYHSYPASAEASEGGFGIKYKHPATIADSLFEVNNNVFLNCSYYSMGLFTSGSYIHHNLIMDSRRIEYSGGYFKTGTVIEHNTFVRGQALDYPNLWGDVVELLTFSNNIVIDNTPEYNINNGIIRIMTYITEQNIYDSVVENDNLNFDNNVYCHSNLDLNGTTAWKLFEADPEPGRAYNFSDWNLLGYDINSIVMSK